MLRCPTLPPEKKRKDGHGAGQIEATLWDARPFHVAEAVDVVVAPPDAVVAAVAPDVAPEPVGVVVVPLDAVTVVAPGVAMVEQADAAAMEAPGAVAVAPVGVVAKA